MIDFDGKYYAIRRIAALLLAKRMNDFEDLARKAPRVIVYEGNSKFSPKLDRTAESGYAVGFRDLINFINDQLPQNEVIEQALRNKVKLVPEVAIREVVANALVHQDFSISGTSVIIEIFANRVEIANPGNPLVPIERFIDGYQSRNERMADLMRRMNICEERSSGIDRLIHAAEVYQLPAPEFRADLRRTRVIIFGHKPFKEMTREDRVRACYQHCSLRWVMSERMTNKSLRERFQLTESKMASVSQIISATIEARLIKQDQSAGDSRKFARYVPIWA